MSEILELFHFLDQHCVTQMEVRRGRIEPSFDSQGSAFFELRRELLFRQNLHGAALNERELLSQVRHDQSFASQPTRKRRISRALPVLSSSSTTIPWSATFSRATSNWRGSWLKNPWITFSLSIPITESNGPHMPRSVM